MQEGEKGKFYITTAIHYANAGPHVGHAYEGVLADILARYHRLRGEETFFLSGTDEHGQKIIRGAEKAEASPQAFVDLNAEKFKDLYDELGLSNDLFIRTSDKGRHFPGAQKLWEIFVEKGDVYKDVYRGLYCVGCERFVVARELEDGKCPDHNEAPQEVEEENYFFRISKYQDRVRAAIEHDELQIYPASRKGELLALLREPLEDISFSRPKGTVPWGIPVPDDPDQMMYVWCDALSNYMSALGFGTDANENFKKFWPAEVHVIGKDILRFHGIYWPAMLLSANLPLPGALLVHGHITSGGKKMSKTLGNVIDPGEYLEKYGTDGFRYYLGREISPFSDGDFTREKFIQSYNGNLAHGIGNLFSRTLSMADKYFDGKIEASKEISTPLQEATSEDGGGSTHQVPYYLQHFVLPKYHSHMDMFEVNEGADVLWDFARVLDGFITEYEPFKLIKTDEGKTRQVLWNTLYGLGELSKNLAPFMPETAEKMKKALGAREGKTSEETVFEISRPDEPLFRKIEEEEE